MIRRVRRSTWCARVALIAGLLGGLAWGAPAPAASSHAPLTDARRHNVERELAADQSYDPAIAARSDAVINEVISRREFRRAAEEGLLQRLQMLVIGAVISLLEQVGSALGGLGPVFMWLGVLVLAVLLALLVLMLARLVEALLQRLDRRRGAAVPEDGNLHGPALTARGPAAVRQALDRARALAAQGQWLEALRTLFAALLLTLDHSGTIDLREGRTNWEYLREARLVAPTQVGSLDQAIRLFEARWYGRRLATRDDYEAMLALLETVGAGTATPR